MKHFSEMKIIHGIFANDLETLRYGLVHIAEPIRKDNVEKLARSIVRALKLSNRKPILAIVTSTTIELHPLVL